MNWVLCASLLVLFAIYRKQLWHNARIMLLPGYATKYQAERKAELRARHEQECALERDRINRIVQAAIAAEQARMQDTIEKALMAERRCTTVMIRSAMNELVQEILPHMVKTMVVGAIENGGNSPVPIARGDYEGILRTNQEISDRRDLAEAEEKEAQQRLACELLDWAKQAIHNNNSVAERHLTESLDSFNDQLQEVEQKLDAALTYYHTRVENDFEATVVGSDIRTYEGIIENIKREIREISTLLNKHVFANTE